MEGLLMTSVLMQPCTANANFSQATLYNQTNVTTEAIFIIPLSNDNGVSFMARVSMRIDQDMMQMAGKMLAILLYQDCTIE